MKETQKNEQMEDASEAQQGMMTARPLIHGQNEVVQSDPARNREGPQNEEKPKN